MAKKQPSAVSKKRKLESYEHKTAKRLNNPPVGLVNLASDPVQEPAKYRCDSHTDPQLNFDSRGDLKRQLDQCYAEIEAAIAADDTSAAQA